MSDNTPVAASPDLPWTEGLSYNQAVKAGDLVFTAGQGGFKADGSLDGDFESQARQALANVEAALAVFGADLQSAVKLTVFLVSADDYGKFKELREELFDEPYPASTLLLGTPVFPEMLIEVEAVASLAGPRRRPS
jgi:enamine deaminase RidA (YjgF/YER057c/UK114 family)